MKNNQFEIKSVIEQQPFQDPATRAFLRMWSTINNAFDIKFISREKWQEKKQSNSILQETEEGKILFLPKDLQLWEIIGIIEALDQETFRNNPEKLNQAKEKIIKLGKIFENSGIYLAQRLNAIKEGKEIAEALALEFYQYGKWLQEGEKKDLDFTIKDLKSFSLTPEEVQEIDIFLGGEKLVKKRNEKIQKLIAKNPEKKEEILEEERQKTLAQFFRIIQKAFEARIKKGQLQTIEDLKPWEKKTPIYDSFLKKIEESLLKKIEIPKQELLGSILNYGIEILKYKMPYESSSSKLIQRILFWKKYESTVRDVLKIEKLKQELEEVKQTGDLHKITKKEIQIVDKIQNIISKITRQNFNCFPATMIQQKAIDCVGASILAGAFLRELNLNYLVASIPMHSALIFTRSDGQIEWRDMLFKDLNSLITNDMIEGVNFKGEPITINDLIFLSKTSIPEGIKFYIKEDYQEWYQERVSKINEKQENYIVVFHPDYGHLAQLLANLTVVFAESKWPELSILTLKEYLKNLPPLSEAYCSLGNIYNTLGKYQEAIELFKKAVSIDPNFSLSYYGLGLSYFYLRDFNKALESFNKFLELADENKQETLINGAKSLIQTIKVLEKIQKGEIY